MDLPGVAPPPSDPASCAASLQDDPRKWWALAVLLLAQVMIILDIAIVNVALPSAQADLHIAATDVPWIVTSYLLPFGGLLLLGGRVADYTGRKRVFAVATVGFAVASGLGGAAGSAGVLFGARALQGFFAAAMAPSLLSMLSLGFPDGKDRTRAFSLFGGVSAAGGGIGLLLGGFLTQYLSWRWSLFINIPLSAIVVAGALPFLRESRASGTPRYDGFGALLGTLGLLGVIFGISHAAQHGWGSADTLEPLIAGLLVVALFLAWESRTRYPLLPLAILRDRTRAGAFLCLAVVYGSPTGITLLLLVFLQEVRGDSPLTAGLHFLPWPGTAIFFALASIRLIDRVSPRILISAGTVITAIGMASFRRVGLHSSFAADILPGLVILGVGTAVLFVTANALALAGIRGRDSGVASAVVNTLQQVGAAVGVAILTTVSANSATGYVAHHGPRAGGQALVHGNDAAFVLASAILLAGGLAAGMLIRPKGWRQRGGSPGGFPSAWHRPRIPGP